MNVKEIKELLELMKEHEVAEIELEKNGLKLKLKKEGPHGQYIQAAPGPFKMAAAPASAAPEASAPAAPAPAGEEAGVELIKSPMVGSFYAAPAPDQPPYVKVGQSVKAGDVLCIIEAMKLMNEIKAEVSGTVTEVAVTNGQPVEFDQVLFKIKA